MTRIQAVGVMLIALGLIYALLYAAWLRKRRRHTSAAVAVDGDAGEGPGDAGSLCGPDPSRVGAEGTYVSTTVAESRLERVAVEGLGNRSRATLTVRRGAPDELLRFERQGESDVVIAAHRFLGVRRERGMAGKFVGVNRVLVIQWRADDGAIYETGFLPRYKADLERLESALWWHSSGTSIANETDMAADTSTQEQEPST
jgi:hypothetical protein